MKIINKILVGPALQLLKKLDDESVNCCVTSPLYWSATAQITTDPLSWSSVEGCSPWIGELGIEPNEDMYLKHVIQILDEVKRVLRKDGSCWVVMGDMYLRKSLRLIPEQFALGMIKHGWKLRSKIIWHKTNKRIRSNIKDRFNLNWEYLFHFTKNTKYYFKQQYDIVPILGKQIKGTVWALPITPKAKYYKFEIFPTELIKLPILSTCPKNGLVLDPFIGSGTTAVVALQLGRNFLGMEISPTFTEIARGRIKSSMRNK